MNDREKIWQTVLRINETCKQGTGFDTLKPYFHENVAIYPPGFQHRAQGRETCLKSYEDACSQMTFQKLDALDEHIDIFGSTAVVSYQYDCVWEYKDKTLSDVGHEILVLSKEGGEWKIVWRTLVVGSREAESCPMEEGESTPASDTMDVRTICSNMMTHLPVCHLTTLDGEGYPQTTAMLNLRCAKEYPSIVPLYDQADNRFQLYMTTSMASNKMARLQANPKVSVYYCDPLQIVGFMLSGDIVVETDQTIKDTIWQDGWTIYYPNGPQGPEYGVIKLVPRLVKGWCRNQAFEFQP